MTWRLLLILFLLTLWITILPTQAQSPDHYIVYAWDNIIYAQSMTTGADLRQIAVDFPGADSALTGAILDVYDRHLSPITTPPLDDYGFAHGIWSADRQQFAFLEIQHLSADYRVSIYQNGAIQQVILAMMDTQRGYLDPLAWTADGRLLLLERRMLHHLDTMRVWELNLTSGELLLYSNNPLGQARGYITRGRTALLPDGQNIFLGFEVESGIGYLYNLSSREVTLFFISQQLPDPLPSVFELFPYKIMGVLPADQLDGLVTRLTTQPPIMPPAPAPFLHWSLPDANRRITCYPDSTWTRSHYNVTCPVLGTMYERHEGTDVGGQPNGLPRNTGVYAMTPGLVVQTNTTCQENTPSCGDAYGNFIGMEHVIVVDGNVQSWYTGYAHLTSVLVANMQYISDIKQPIGASGATGLAGAHLHMEVRYPHQTNDHQWVDPWEVTINGTNLWIGGVTPVSAELYQPLVARP